MCLLRDELIAVGEKLSEMVPEKKVSQVEEFESYPLCSIPEQIDIQPPNDTCSRGRNKRIKGRCDKRALQNRNEKTKNQRVPHKCKTCKQVALRIVTLIFIGKSACVGLLDFSVCI